VSRSDDASPPVSRRGFLQTAGAVGAQLALGDSAAYAMPSTRITFGRRVGWAM
jgi:hypothetical protein